MAVVMNSGFARRFEGDTICGGVNVFARHLGLEECIAAVDSGGVFDVNEESKIMEAVHTLDKIQAILEASNQRYINVGARPVERQFSLKYLTRACLHTLANGGS